MPKQIRVERAIRGEADELYDLISDLPRMGEWSPENTGGHWVNGAAGPVVGARFKGTNKKGLAKWSTDVVVTEAQRGQQFSFDVTRGSMKLSKWDYNFEQHGGITSVIQTWTDQRPPVIGTVVNWMIGVRDRAERNRQNMEATLANLAAQIEV